MKRRTILWGLTLPILGSVIACDMGDPAPKKQEPVDPNEPPKPDEADTDWHLGATSLSACKVTVWVEPAACPFYVTIDAHDITLKQDINVISSDKELGLRVDGGKWTIPIAYEKGDDVRINVHVKSAGKSSKGYIAIREGSSHYGRSAQFGGTAAANLEYQTQRR